jgi:hypothetical protein
MNIEELRRLVDETAASATKWHILAIQFSGLLPDPTIPALRGGVSPHALPDHGGVRP